MMPLSDTLVLDLTQVIAGPTAGQILGDMGADVIKVEPLHGEHFRPHFGGAWVPSMNRNKRGLAVDLRSEGGRDVLMRLVAQGRRLHGGLHAGRDRQTGLRLGDAGEGESAPGLCFGLGLRPDRALLRPRRLRSLHPGRDRPDGRDRPLRRRDVPRRHGGHRLFDRLILRRRHRLRAARPPQDRPRPAARPVAVRCRHAPDEPLDHQPRADRRGSRSHGHLEHDPLSAARLPDQDAAGFHRRRPTTRSGACCARLSASRTGWPTSVSRRTPIASPIAPSSNR